MTSAYILIASILVLGGVLAALGDRLGSKIGKKRMRLFNLRPRQTATLMTIGTGILIASSTLGLLFGLSKSLRQGVFELDRILSERRAAIRQLERELKKAREDKEKIQKELQSAQTEQTTAQKRLSNINRNFQQSQRQLKTVTQQLSTLRTDVATLLKDRQQLQQQKNQLTTQKDRLATQRNQLTTQLNELQGRVQTRDREIIKREQQLTEQDRLLAQRQTRLQSLEKEQKELQTEIDDKDEQIDRLDGAIADKDKNLELREAKLEQLETQLSYLRREVEVLEQYYQTYQDLRERKIAIVRGQVLAFGAFRVVKANDARSIIAAIDQILQKANLSAIQATQPNTSNTEQQVVQITKAQVEQLVEQLRDGREYVVRILSAGNYVLGEKEIRVFADVAPNQKIYEESQEIAAVSIDSQNMSEEDIQKRLDLLLAASQFQARRAGVLGSIQVEDGRLTSLIGFIDKINDSDDTIDEIKTVAATETYTSGPLKIRLVAIINGEIAFST